VRTVEHYDYARRRLLAPYLGRVKLNRLTALDVQRLLSELTADGKSARQRQTAYVTLHCALEQAVEWGLIPMNPVTKVARPKVEEREMRALAPEEVARLLDAAAGDPYEALFSVMVFCGLRWGEVEGLQWRDVDWHRRLLSVRRAVEETAEGITLGEVKSKASHRSVALPEAVLDALREHRQRLQATPHPTRLVFGDANGGLLRRGNFGRRHWRPIRERAGLQGLRLHDLRHTAATLALLAGSDAKTLQARLGHSSAAFTLQRYGHAMEDAQRAVADKLSDLVSSSSRPKRQR
jgi:integrase